MKFVRAKQPGHFLQLADLQTTVLPSDVPYPTDRGAWWLVYDDGKPVAFAGVVPFTRWCDCAYLCRAGVLPTHRGKGLQKRLIALREQYARRVGMKWVVTDTTANPASSNSLISRQYRLFDPTKPWGPSGALYWRKRLD
jgi:GNAT superfamily N-acetyltransferase